jgi:hypothetical protein
MAMDTKTDATVIRSERREVWGRHFEEQARSGQSVKAYCAAHELKVWQWSYWRKAIHGPREAQGGFVELRTAAADELRLECGGCQISLRRGFDVELLRQVVSALRTP